MANREQGEVSIEIEGKSYTLCIDLYAWALVQDALTKGNRVPSFEQVADRLQAAHALTVIAVFWASLQRHHSSIDSLQKASQLLRRSDGTAAEALMESIKRSSPDTEDLQDLGVQVNPQVAQVDLPKTRGTGARFTSKRAVSA